MADLTINTAEVLSESGPTEWGQAGEAITIGQSVYRAGNQKWYKAQNDGTAVESGNGTRTGVAVTGAAADGYFIIQRGGTLTLGATAAPVVGTIYCVSATAGGICPHADVGSTKRVTILGVGGSSNRLLMGPGVNASGAVVP